MTEEEKQDIIEQLKKGAKRYTCCCGETFSKMYNFRKHLLKRHRKEWDECFEKIKVKSISTDKNLGAHIIETNDEYLFCYSTKNTFKLDASSKGIKKEKKKKKQKKNIGQVVSDIEEWIVKEEKEIEALCQNCKKKKRSIITLESAFRSDKNTKTKKKKTGGRTRRTSDDIFIPLTKQQEQKGEGGKIAKAILPQKIKKKKKAEYVKIIYTPMGNKR